MYSYVLWLLIFAVLPVIVLFFLNFDLFKAYKKVLIFTLFGSLMFAIVWDFLAIKTRIWYFTKPHILGIYFLNLPIEELIFITFESLLFAMITLILWQRKRR